MLRNSFIFLDAVGPKKEKNLWKQGVCTWRDFLEKGRIKGFSEESKKAHDLRLRKATQALVSEDSKFFNCLPHKENWRLYETFKDKALFLDIEIGSTYKDIILVGLFDGYDTKFLVKNANLDKGLFFKELNKYKLLITFNGAAFDIPALERYFRTAIDLPHIDLKHCCLKLGLKGGLKEIEHELDLKRPRNLYGSPSDLWKAFHASGDREYLNLLLQYNEEDIVNLKPIAEYCCRELKRGYLKNLK